MPSGLKLLAKMLHYKLNRKLVSKLQFAMINIVFTQKNPTNTGFCAIGGIREVYFLIILA